MKSEYTTDTSNLRNHVDEKEASLTTASDHAKEIHCFPNPHTEQRNKRGKGKGKSDLGQALK